MISTSQAEQKTLRWVFDAVPHSITPKITNGETKSVSAKCGQSHYVKGMESYAQIGSSNGTKVGGGEKLRTVECLRGRLLAERQASKVANETAEILGNKVLQIELSEIESKLKEEIKLREKAERKLNFLKKKLQSLNISYTSGESDQSYSPEKFDYSCGSSTSDSVSKTSQDIVPKSQTANPVENLVKNVSGASTPNRSQCAEDSSSQVTFNASSNSNISCSLENHDEDGHCVDLEIVKNRPSISKFPVLEHEKDDEEYVDNSLALVPFNMPHTSEPTKMKPVNDSVAEALEALRFAREMLISSLQTKYRN